MKIGIVGLGLMGGSFALDLKSIYPSSIICGYDISKSNSLKALNIGFIDKIIDLKDLSFVDLVIVSVPVDVAINLVSEILNIIGKDSIVLDVGSTKAPICDFLKLHPKRKNFLACHPMAGTEFSGPESAINGLYFNKTNIICEKEKTCPKLFKKVNEIFKRFRMKNIFMDPVSHDTHVAYVSHLSHVSSFMLGKTVIEKEKNEKNIFDLAGSGFESTVRLAKSSPETWTPIFLQNKNNIADAIDEYIYSLEEFKKNILENDKEKLKSVLNKTNRIKEILNKNVDHEK